MSNIEAAKGVLRIHLSLLIMYST